MQKCCCVREWGGLIHQFKQGKTTSMRRYGERGGVPPLRFFHLGWLVCLWLLIAYDAAAWVGQKDDSDSTGVLAARVDAFLKGRELSRGRIGVLFCDDDSGGVLYARGDDQVLKPASNVKLLTTAAALDVLGPDFRYKTLLATRGRRKGAALEGDLVVLGSGDPSISGRFVADHDRRAIFRDWARAVSDHGIARVTGDIVGVDDAFDDQAQAIGWPNEDRAEWYCAEISALAFNDDCVDLRWEGGEAEKPARLELLPPTAYARVVNFVTSARGEGPFERFYSRGFIDNTITARGRIGVGENVVDSAAVSNPTLYFVTVLAETLRESGIAIQGRPRDVDEFADKSIFRQSLEPLATYESPPLARLVEVVNRNSHNFYAEQILKTMGKCARDEGSFKAGTAVVRSYIERQGIDCTGVNLADGSGLSRLNRASAGQIASVLRAASRGGEGALYRNSLPRGGQTGSLRKRFVADEELKRVGVRIRAKTGYIRGAHALSGWFETEAGQSICFSILCNDLPMSDAETKLFLERLVALVAGLKYRL
jgi:D-alanyl-D-alanine carboxypeptidase/D-alanyl-D-alanine-endopeptidase (penicillin-binding protein 4)